MDDVTYEPLCKDDSPEEPAVVIASVPTPEGAHAHRINTLIAAVLICLSSAFCLGTVLWLAIFAVRTVEDEPVRNRTQMDGTMLSDLWRFR